MTGGIEEGAVALQGDTHLHEHVRHHRDGIDGLAELLAGPGIAQGLFIGGLADPECLAGDPETGAVHHVHDILDEAELALADQLRRHVVELEFAGR